ncbi:MAG: hypothetical protein PWQ17_862 [Anaerophaga sp.]|nr:hypothetical protein [Anaerophaga sp.]MDK2841357.1 hypothetical protein [Anaerophaga sp.]MDN5292179.1 hypothetical protein [Anaerophaga sp.]
MELACKNLYIFYCGKLYQACFVNEYFGGKRNTANGTLWTDPIYLHNQ